MDLRRTCNDCQDVLKDADGRGDLCMICQLKELCSD